MTIRFTAFAASLALILGVHTASAQVVTQHSITGHSAYNAVNHLPTHGHFAVPLVVHRPYFAGSYPFAGVIRAQGERNVLDSMALINLQQARSMAIDNHRKEVDTFFALREAHDQRRAAERVERLARRDARIAHQQPKTAVRLGPGEFDPATGQLAWPSGLEGETLAAHRDRIESLLHPQSPELRAADLVLDEVRQLREQLETQVAQLRPMEWIAAKQFLDRLAGEVGFPASGPVLASR
jgi:hypothetical protein